MKSQEIINQTTRFLEKTLSGQDYKTFILIQPLPLITKHILETSAEKILDMPSALVSKTDQKNVLTMI